MVRAMPPDLAEIQGFCQPLAMGQDSAVGQPAGAEPSGCWDDLQREAPEQPESFSRP